MALEQKIQKAQSHLKPVQKATYKKAVYQAKAHYSNTTQKTLLSQAYAASHPRTMPHPNSQEAISPVDKKQGSIQKETPREKRVLTKWAYEENLSQEAILSFSSQK